MNSNSASSFQFSSAVSFSKDVMASLNDVIEDALAQLNNQTTLAIVFANASWIADTPDFAKIIKERTGASTVIGCTGESIIGTGIEIEGKEAVVLWLASLPDAAVEAAHIQCQRLDENHFTFPGWPDQFKNPWGESSQLLLLVDPFSFAVDAFIEKLHQDHPNLLIAGGVASGAHKPGEHRLILNEEIISGGAIALHLSGPIACHHVVSQGCQPVGQNYIITHCHDNVIEKIGNETSSELLQNIFKNASEREQLLLQQGVFVGLVIDEYQQEFGRGDFVIRNILGVDPRNGAITITDHVRRGQKIQFHVRDHISATEDMKELLENLKKTNTSIQGGLVFSCNGRGSHMFLEPHHDAMSIKEIFGDIPLAGFFCNGEIGPIGNRNFLHGFTASMIFFEQPSSQDQKET